MTGAWVARLAEVLEPGLPEPAVVRQLVERIAAACPGRGVVLLVGQPGSEVLTVAEASADWATAAPHTLLLTPEEVAGSGLPETACYPVTEPGCFGSGAVETRRHALGGPAVAGLLALERTAADPPFTGEDEAALAAAAAVVTAILSAQRLLQRTAERGGLAAELVAQTDALVFVVDPETRVTFLNPAVERLTGFAERHVRGRRLGDWLGPGEDGGFLRAIIEALAGRPRAGFEVTLPLRVGGRITAFFTTAALYGEDRRVTGVAAVGLGQRHLAELRARHEARLARLQQVTAGITGRLEAPVEELERLGEGLRRVLGGAAAGAATEGLDRIAAVTRSLAELRERLGALAGGAGEELASLSLNQVMEEALAQAQGWLTGRRARVRTALAGELPPLYGMRAALRSACVHLLRNACQALPEEGRVTVRTWDNRDGTVGLSIADTGCGVPEEQLPHLFRPFFSAAGDPRRLGLGLAVVQDVVDLHDGSVDVDSVEGEGTVVTIILPVRGQAGTR